MIDDTYLLTYVAHFLDVLSLNSLTCSNQLNYQSLRLCLTNKQIYETSHVMTIFKHDNFDLNNIRKLVIDDNDECETMKAKQLISLDSIRCYKQLYVTLIGWK